jgi:hypothetical protein
MVTRIASMVVRLCAVAALTLGILFWTGNADQYRDIHMLIGILLVLALWTVAFSQITRPGGIGMAAAAVVTGILLAIVGVTQERIFPGSSHWVIQVVHLGLALLAIGLAETIARRASRAAKSGGTVKSA